MLASARARARDEISASRRKPRMKPLPACLFLLIASAMSAPLEAQRLPVQLPRLPGQIGDTLAGTLDRATGTLRQVRIDQLLRQHGRELDRDHAGAPVVRGEVVAIDPSPEALASARAAGFLVLRESRLAEFDLRMVVLAAPGSMRARAALRRLQRLDPAGQYDYNHLYLGAEASPVTEVDMAAAIESVAASPRSAALRVGLVDSGVEAAHASLAGVDVRTWGCNGTAHPDAHGTAVASLLAGEPWPGGVRSRRGHAELFAADIYCGAPAGGAVTGLAQALAWLVAERVSVINLSLVGPSNALLERLVTQMVKRGHVIVAAVGNDGPAAPPLYPAAYPGVIGVTAVDARGRVLPEAGRGAHVDVAAPGSALHVAAAGHGWTNVRGTSFAAPLVARRAAAAGSAPMPGLAASTQLRLEREAIDAGSRGRDTRYGAGVLAAQDQARWRMP